MKKLLTNHHYYLEFYKSSDFKNVKALTSYVDWFKPSQLVKIDDSKYMSYHKYQSDKEFGAESVINKLYNEKSNDYSYPILIGHFIKKRVICLCYPYKRLNFITNGIRESHSVESIGIEFDNIVAHMKNRNLKNVDYYEKEDSNYLTSIKKYVAEVKHKVEGVVLYKKQSKASYVFLKGDDPLDSEFYQFISSSEDFEIRNLSGRLVIDDIEGLSQLRIAFDLHGNFRIYLSAKGFIGTLNIIKYLYEYLEGIEALTTIKASPLSALESSEFI